MSEEHKYSSFEESSAFIDEEQTSETNETMSSDGLEIDITENPLCKEEIDIEDNVLENIEEEIERQYDEKAAKSNLTAVNVKNILKHVITNEHVWAMVRNTTEDNLPDAEAEYQPKLTRAKTKELLKNQNVPVGAIPWGPPSPKSEVHILINQELPEDSDDDEYIPHEEESEDEKDSVNPSDVDSQPATPATPTSTHDNSTQTIWTEDGIFKIPATTPTKTPTHETNTEDIYLRTRSKLSLSDTPLEIIEEAFIPPDITTDMYDLECDDEDWKDFLKKFTRPLDEAQGLGEDEDEDPEYNVLSDEEINNKLNKEELEEELRQDRGVKITKKELNTLVAELFEYSEMFTNEKSQEAMPQNPETSQNPETPAETSTQPPENFQQTPETSFAEVPVENFPVNSTENFSQTSESLSSQQNLSFEGNKSQIIFQKPVEVKLGMTMEQTILFEQQMRQHVQMLTQNYILAYKNIYFNHLAKKFKDMILSLEELSKYKGKTAFRPHNLSFCVDFINDWDKLIASNSQEVQDMFRFVSKVAQEYLKCDLKNIEYVCCFPTLLMKKVTESPAFMYPNLLPKIPFRYSQKRIIKSEYLRAENDLIALGLEQFREYLSANPISRPRNGNVNIKDVCEYICRYMMPKREPKKLYWYIQRMRYMKSPNPINYFFVNKKAPIAMHYVCPLDQYGALPPKLRPPESLPYQWRNFLYPEAAKPQEGSNNKKPKRAVKPPAFRKPPKKKVIKISNPPDPLGLNSNALNNSLSPVLVINNFPTNSENNSEVKPPIIFIQNNIVAKENINESDKISVPSESLLVPAKSSKKPAKKLINNKPQEKTFLQINETVFPQKSLENQPPAKRKRLILPKVEQIFIKTHDYLISNTNSTINRFLNSEILEPPPISTTEQIKKFTPDLLKVQFNSSIFQRVKHLEMLPSMPFLLTPMKENRNLNDSDSVSINPVTEEDPLEVVLPEETKIEENTAEENLKTQENTRVEESLITLEQAKIEENQENLTLEGNESSSLDKDIKKDDEDELNALMVASSTMQQKNRRLQPNLTKKAKQMREYNATLAMLCPENPNISDEKAKNFAQAYYDKVQERLESDSPVEYQKFIEVLSDHDETKSTVSDLYERVSSVLSPKHPDLCEEFLTFLTPEQAQQIGKLVPHFMLSNMSLFLRKLEIYYSNQPAQLRKIYNCLTELADTKDVTMEKVKSTILPLLKGNALLIDWFVQMFPQEPPPESSMTDWEQINCDEEDRKKDKIFETLNLPEVEDPYGGPNCICKCHQIEEETFKSRTRHCIPCGTKFLQGRVYVQTGKGLRLAKVTFSSPKSDYTKRLNVKPSTRTKRKSETSPSKIMSPTKEEEIKFSIESEEDNTVDITQKKLKPKNFRTSSPSKSRKKSVAKTVKIKKETAKNKKLESAKKLVKKQDKKGEKKAEKTEEKIEEDKLEEEKLEEEKLEEEKLEEEKLEEEKIEEGKIEVKKLEIMESENEENMDTCEESSQDTLEESDDSLEEIETEISEDSNSPPEYETEIIPGYSWKREEDRTLLQTFQKYGETAEVFKEIQKLLPERKEPEIKQRFQILMSLIQEMKK